MPDYNNKNSRSRTNRRNNLDFNNANFMMQNMTADGVASSAGQRIVLGQSMGSGSKNQTYNVNNQQKQIGSFNQNSINFSSLDQDVSQ